MRDGIGEKMVATCTPISMPRANYKVSAFRLTVSWSKPRPPSRRTFKLSYTRSVFPSIAMMLPLVRWKTALIHWRKHCSNWRGLSWAKTASSGSGRECRWEASESAATRRVWHCQRLPRRQRSRQHTSRPTLSAPTSLQADAGQHMVLRGWVLGSGQCTTRT